MAGQIEVATLITRLEAKTADHDNALRKSGDVVDQIGARSDRAGKQSLGFFANMKQGAGQLAQSFAPVSGGLDNLIGGFGRFAPAALGPIGIVGGALAALGVTAVSSFVDFEGKMREVFTLLPGISQQAMGAMMEDVQDFSREFGVLPNDVIPSLYQALSAGVPAGNVFEFLETAQKAAVGGVTDLTTAVNGISSVVNAYGADVIDATRVSDLMFTSVRMGKTTFGELSSSLFQVIPLASSLGVSFDQVTASIASMTAQGVPTATTTTQLRQLFAELSKEGTKVSTVFRQVAGQSFKEFIASGKNTQQALQLLETHAQKTGIGINDLFGSIEAGSAALILTGRGTETFTRNLQEMQGSFGATQKAYETMDQGIGRGFARLQATVMNFLLDIGQHLAPFVSQLVDTIGQGLSGAFEVLEPILAVVLPLLGEVGSVLLNVIGAALSVVGGILGTFKAAWEQDFLGIRTITEFVGGAIMAILDGITQALGFIGDAFGALGGWIKEGLKLIGVNLDQAAADVQKPAEQIGQNISESVQKGVSKGAEDLATTLTDDIKNLNAPDIPVGMKVSPPGGLEGSVNAEIAGLKPGPEVEVKMKAMPITFHDNWALPAAEAEKRRIEITNSMFPTGTTIQVPWQLRTDSGHITTTVSQVQGAIDATTTGANRPTIEFTVKGRVKESFVEDVLRQVESMDRTLSDSHSRHPGAGPSITVPVRIVADVLSFDFTAQEGGTTGGSFADQVKATIGPVPIPVTMQLPPDEELKHQAGLVQQTLKPVIPMTLNIPLDAGTILQNQIDDLPKPTIQVTPVVPPTPKAVPLSGIPGSGNLPSGGEMSAWWLRQGTFADDAKKAGDAGVAALVKSLTEGIKAATSAAAGIVSGTISIVRQGFNPGTYRSVGLAAILALAAGQAAGGGTARAAAMQVTGGVRGAVAATMAPGFFVGSGRWVGVGLAAGIAQTRGLAIAEARATALAVRSVVNSTLGIASKSKEAEKSGMFWNEGLESGLGRNERVLAIAEGTVKQVIEVAKRVMGKGTVELAEGFGKLLDVTGSAFGLVGDLGSKDFAAPTRAVVDRFIDATEYIALRTSGLLHKHARQFSEDRAKLAGFAKSIVETFSGAIDMVSTLGGKDFALPGRGAVEGAFRALDEILSRTEHLLSKYGGDEARASAAEMLGRMVEGIGKGLDTLSGLVAFIKPADGNIMAFIDSFEFMVNKLGERIKGWTREQLEMAALYGESTGEFVAGIGAGLDVLVKLREFIKPADGNLISFIDSLQLLINRFGERIRGWSEEGLQLAGFYGEQVSKLLGMLSSGVDLLGKLAAKEFTLPATEGVNNFINTMVFMIEEFRNRVLGVWVPKAMETTGLLATEAGKVVATLAAAVDMVAKLGKEDFVRPAILGASNFFLGFSTVVDLFKTKIPEWEDAFTKRGAGDLGSKVGTAVESILKAVGGLGELGKDEFTNPTRLILGASNFFMAFAGLIDQFATRVGDWTDKFGGDAGVDTANIAGHVGKVVGALVDTVKLFTELGKPDAAIASLTAVDAFWDALNRFWERFKAKQEDWINSTGLVSSATAKVIAEAINNLTGGISGLQKLADPKLAFAADEVVDLFFSKLDYFVRRFAERAAEWKDLALDKSSELAGHIGAVSENINKALDPILKMKDAQAITPAQIEGSMANVWFALHHFNMVMRGGSEGTPFQGAWMEQAKAFATGIGEIFDALKGAFGVMSEISSADGAGASEGFAAAMGALRTSWLGLFGPAAQEGTLLNLLFKREHGGFFFDLRLLTLEALDFYRFYWGGKLFELTQFIQNEKLPEMLAVAGNYGREAAKALADAFVAEMEAQQARINDALEFLQPDYKKDKDGKRRWTKDDDSKKKGDDGSWTKDDDGKKDDGDRRWTKDDNTPYVPIVTKDGMESTAYGPTTIINNPLYINGQYIEDPDYHKRSHEMRKRTHRRAGGPRVGKYAT